MSYIGEIRMFAGNFAPAGWAMCNGDPLPISEHDALFTLIGTTYGGDGQETFNLPDLRGRLPVHWTTTLGEMEGVESVTLTTSQLPTHTHTAVATNAFAQASTPTGGVLGRSSGADPYSTDPTVGMVNMAPASLSPAGGSQPHDNFQPYLCITFILSLYGEFPQPT